MQVTLFLASDEISTGMDRYLWLQNSNQPYEIRIQSISGVIGQLSVQLLFSGLVVFTCRVHTPSFQLVPDEMQLVITNFYN